jgi:hypothetical protein
MKILLFAILWVGIQTTSWASSGMAPFWLYQTAEGTFLARMSDKAEQDDYNGVTQGAVKSKLLVYKMTNGNIPAKPTFVTTAICESYRNDPVSIKCPNASGAFSGTAYKLNSNYIFEAAGKGKLKPKLVQGSIDQAQKNRAMLLISEYVKSKDYKGSFGLSGFGIFNCLEGCKSTGTPDLMVEVDLMGD